VYFGQFPGKGAKAGPTLNLQGTGKQSAVFLRKRASDPLGLADRLSPKKSVY